MKARPIVAITTGDPSGIGPEIVQKAIRNPRVIEACQPLVFGPAAAGDVELVRTVRSWTATSTGPASGAVVDSVTVSEPLPPSWMLSNPMSVW